MPFSYEFEAEAAPVRADIEAQEEAGRDKRAEGWDSLQALIERLTQTLFNVRDANLAAGRDITDAPEGVREAVDSLQDELARWRGKFAEQRAAEARAVLQAARDIAIATGRPLGGSR